MIVIHETAWLARREKRRRTTTLSHFVSKEISLLQVLHGLVPSDRAHDHHFVRGCACRTPPRWKLRRWSCAAASTRGSRAASSGPGGGHWA